MEKKLEELILELIGKVKHSNNPTDTELYCRSISILHHTLKQAESK